MVLQRAPLRANIWGFGEEGQKVELTVVEGSNGFKYGTTVYRSKDNVSCLMHTPVSHIREIARVF